MRYQGDENLEQLMSDAGVPHSISDIYELMAGILSAPKDTADPDRWLYLISSHREEAMDAQLKALKDDIENSSIETEVTPDDLADRLAAVRRHMSEHKYDGFLVPRADEFQGEYVPLCAERLSWITGFTGSAGMAIIMLDKAGFFTDGRYTIAAKAEVPASLYQQCSISPNQGNVPTISPTAWLEQHVTEGQNIAYDPWLHTHNQIEAYRHIVHKNGGQLIPADQNPIDQAWVNRPPPPLSLTVEHPIEFAGKTSDEKRKELGRELQHRQCDAVVLTLPEDIAWLLNIRGGDVPCTPLPLSFAIFHQDRSVQLFIDVRKLGPGVMHYLGHDIQVLPMDRFKTALGNLGQGRKSVIVDPNTAASAIFDILENANVKIMAEPSPCQLPKSCKNKAEVTGAVHAHIRDGVALCRFLAQLANADKVQHLTEMSAATMLEKYRAENDHYRGQSFETISGMGSNGAIVHYRVTEKTDKPLTDGALYLVDSGGQYLDGTTDVTRTVALAPPTEEMKDHFTRVLKGHIQVALATFDKTETGGGLDNLARASLKEAGLDFAHGTGHGVGSYLSVHEGPQGISPRSKTPFQPGMITSNEPGYYQSGEYGIRIENLVVCVRAERDKMTFRTLTMAPIDRQLIIADMLNEIERQWLNDYHIDVRRTIRPELEKIDPKAAQWLVEATQPI